MRLSFRGIETQDGLYHWRRGQYLSVNLVENFLSGTKECRRTRVVEDVRPITGQLSFIHGYNGCVERVGGSCNGGPFPSIVGNDAHLGKFRYT